MDEKTQQVISCKVSAEEAETIKVRAAMLGISISEYVRNRALSLPTEASAERLEALIKHGIYMANQIYVGLFSIAEAQGKVRRFLSGHELQQVYDQVRADAMVYALEFPTSFAAVQAELAAAAKTGAK